MLFIGFGLKYKRSSSLTLLIIATE